MSALLQGCLRHADQGIKVHKDHKHDILYSVYILNTATKVATVPYSQLHPDGGDLMPTTEFFNVREAAKQLNIHENTVRNLKKRGKLKAVRLPGSGFRRFLKKDIERMRQEMWSQSPRTPRSLQNADGPLNATRSPMRTTRRRFCPLHS